MRLVTSPTARKLLTALSVSLAAILMTPSTAIAAAPPAPGDFTGYGFDTCVAPSQKVMDMWNLRSPYAAVGIYISGNSRYCGDKYQPNLTKAWVAKNAANGWRFLPINVGYQAPCFKNNPKSRVQKHKMSYDFATARAQSRRDAAAAVKALVKYGFAKGSVTYLDIEAYAISNSKCNSATLHFIDEWNKTVRAKGFKVGLYSSAGSAIKAVAAKRSASWFHLPDHMWIARWNGVANTDAKPYLSDSVWAKHQRIHQYTGGTNVTYGGLKLNIDNNFLDVGKGSVATKDAQPCDVKLSFSSYPRLARGSSGPEVSALQCLLKEQGLKKDVNGEFGDGTAKAVDAFRAKFGWAATGHTTVATWTALLSAGSKPRVLKQGSVGEPVWRLQRALVGAGLSLKITGVYDAKTVATVKTYREKYGLTRYATTESSVWALLQRGKIG